MKINRRDLLFAGGLSLLAGIRAFGHGADGASSCVWSQDSGGPARPLAMRGLEGWNLDAVRTIHGYDAAVIWKGARASSG